MKKNAVLAAGTPHAWSAAKAADQPCQRAEEERCGSDVEDRVDHRVDAVLLAEAAEPVDEVLPHRSIIAAA